MRDKSARWLGVGYRLSWILCFRFVFALDWALVAVDGFDSTGECEVGEQCTGISTVENRPTCGLTVPDEHDIISLECERRGRRKASDGPKGPWATCFFFFFSPSPFLLLHHRQFPS